MRVLYLDLERAWRGGQSQALYTLEGLRALGHEAELVAVAGYPLAERSAAAGIQVYTVPETGMRLRAARLLRELWAKKRYDILHINESHGLTGAWMAGARNRPHVVLSRRVGYRLQNNWVSQQRFKIVERFIANSETWAGVLRDCGIEGERIAVVNEGVEIPEPVSAEARKKARDGIRDRRR